MNTTAAHTASNAKVDAKTGLVHITCTCGHIIKAGSVKGATATAERHTKWA